jgi:hypothetical protein
MIVLGLVLLVIGWLVGISLLVTLGVILLVVGLVLYVLGAVGRPVAGRRHYW